MQRNFLSMVGFVTLFWLMAASSQSALAMSEFQTQTENETFFGTILRNGDNFVLSDSATKTKYTLDHPQMARRYEGITVKVTGCLDTARNLIQVETIKPIVLDLSEYGPASESLNSWRDRVNSASHR
jgi:hypothetical protein